MDTENQKQDSIGENIEINSGNEEPETIGGNDETTLFNQTKAYKKYKIQEVIKPRQVILIQINKEERGLKGAALTTFLSFAGRYCVLMPNSLNSDGISRKIGDIEERKILKIRRIKQKKERQVAFLH